MDPKDCHILFRQKYIPKDSRPYLWSSMLLFFLVAVLIGNHQPVDHPVFPLLASICETPYKLGPRKISGNLWQCSGTFGEYGYKLVADRSTTGENLTLPGIFLLFFLFCLFFLPGFIRWSSSTFCLPWATHGKRKLLIFSVVPPCT